MASLQQLSQQQLEHANFLERAKHNLKKEGFALKKKINKIIFQLARNLSIFLTFHIFVCDGEWDDTFTFWAVSLCWITIWCSFALSTYLMIGAEIQSIDRLLQRDELLKTNVDVFVRNVQDSFEVYRVTGEFIGGSAVALDIKVSPHIVDRGVCVSQLAVLKQLVEEPLVASNCRFTYQMLVITLSLFGILFAIGWSVIVDYYAMRGDEHLSSKYHCPT